MGRNKLTLAAVVFALSLVFGGAGAGVARAAESWRWPVSGRVITPYRNGTDRFAGGQHRGIDIAAAVGTPVVAATRGTVSFAGVAGSSGLTVAVRTSGGDLETTYLHLSSVAVRAGQRVSGGDRIGAVGVSGRRSAEQPHLHFGVRDAADRFAYRDPLDFLPAPAPEPRPDSPAPRAVPVAAPSGPTRVPALVPLPGVPALARAPASSHPTTSSAPVGLRAADSVAHVTHTPAAGPRSPPRPHMGDSRLHTHESPAARSPDATRSLSSGPHVSHVPDGPQRVRRPSASRDDGPDIGWLTACLGLLVAAVLLGRSSRPRSSLARGRNLVVELLADPSTRAR